MTVLNCTLSLNLVLAKTGNYGFGETSQIRILNTAPFDILLMVVVSQSVVDIALSEMLKSRALGRSLECDITRVPFAMLSIMVGA